MERSALFLGWAIAILGAALLFMNLLLPEGSRVALIWAIGPLFVLVGAGIAVPRAQRFIADMYQRTLTFLIRVWPGGGKRAGAESPPPPMPDDEPLDLPFETDPKPRIDTVWTTARDVRRPILELVGPMYVLDSTYHFLDWNPAFDLLIATPLGLRRGEHAQAFVRHLANVQKVVERAKVVFAPGSNPLVDVELLEFRSGRYGLIRFQKLAAQIADEQGNTLAWSVCLNILDAEKGEDLWNDLRHRMEKYVSWARYAVSYDKLLLNFDDYLRLVSVVAGMVDAQRRCIDLGAGTGNGTIQLLETSNGREVWAVEENETMLEYLRRKIRQRERDEGRKYSDRLTVVKADIGRLEELPQAYFDAAICVNVLYAVEDPRKCLRQAWNVLRPGGVLALSTSHHDTDVPKLFARMREVLTAKGLFESLKANYESALAIHESMDAMIHRDTKADVRKYLEDAGFRIDEWREREYVNAVVVAKAVKV